MTEPLTWLAEHKNCELSFNRWDEDPVWQVHSVNGGRNDREWTLRATGSTPEEALRKAMAVHPAQTATVTEADVIIVAARLRGLSALKDDYGQIQHEKVRKALEASSLSSTNREARSRMD